MKEAAHQRHYDARLSRVTAYIHDHLDDELDLNRLADIACVSPYHWHRIYHAIHGETIAATVKRLRLHRAAGYLAHSAMAIKEVAEKSGYGSVQSFTRLFHAAYGMPPARYRKEGSHQQFKSQQAAEIAMSYDVKIASQPPLTAVTLDHQGSYMLIGRAFDTLFGWLGSRNLIGPGTRSIGVYLDDPSIVPETQLRSKAGVILNQPIALEAPLALTEVAGGTYAVLTYKGPYADMKFAYQWLYGTWLVQSGREAADAPVYEEYLNDPRNTAPTELLTAIYLPLR